MPCAMRGKLAFWCLRSAVRVGEIEGRITESPLDVKLDGVLHEIMIIWCLDIELSYARSFDGICTRRPFDWCSMNSNRAK